MSNGPLAFLQLLGDNFWLQTFDDKKRKEKLGLVQDFFVSEAFDEPNFLALLNLNEKGAGVYFCVNQLQHVHKKRTADNVEYIRAFFCDLDGAPLGPVLQGPLKPNVIVRSSKQRWHAYWIMAEPVGADRRLFKELQQAIAKRFNGDPSVSDLCRVMRLPGFFNMKHEPFFVTYEVLTEKPYNLEEIKNEYMVAGVRQSSNHDCASIAGNNVLAGDTNIAGWVNHHKYIDVLFQDAGKGGADAAADECEFDSARLRGAMLNINPDDYDAWITVGLALQGAAKRPLAEISLEEAFEYWITWSQLSNKYNELGALEKWEGLEARSEMGLGTIFKMASDAGWKGERRNFWTVEEIREHLKNMA